MRACARSDTSTEEQADVRLILVRIRRRAHTAASDAEAVRVYMADLGAWAEAHGIPLLVFADKDRFRHYEVSYAVVGKISQPASMNIRNWLGWWRPVRRCFLARRLSGGTRRMADGSESSPDLHREALHTRG